MVASSYCFFSLAKIDLVRIFWKVRREISSKNFDTHFPIEFDFPSWPRFDFNNSMDIIKEQAENKLQEFHEYFFSVFSCLKISNSKPWDPFLISEKMIMEISRKEMWIYFWKYFFDVSLMKYFILCKNWIKNLYISLNYIFIIFN